MTNHTEGENSSKPFKELKWMAEFLAKHGQPKKALEIYRELVDSMSKTSEARGQEKSEESEDRAA
ncbi:MAG TPA: hypothetical protein PKZ32_11945 [Candidatus Melainabacteria bacterium]|nr:hypothetical protein [Candidatus Melainabacteria bacterium]